MFKLCTMRWIPWRARSAHAHLPSLVLASLQVRLAIDQNL
jgi:hypothetical protein